MPASSLPWWLATTACSPPPLSDASSLPDRLAFLFLSPCPQRALLGAIDLLFLLATLAIAIHAGLSRSCYTSAAAAISEHDNNHAQEPLLAKPTTAPPRRGSFRHRLALVASTALAAASLVLLALALLLLLRTAWLAAECAFLAAQFTAHLAAAGVVATEKAAAARAHPVHLRLFWLGTAGLAELFSGSAVVRYAAGEPILPDDPIVFAGLVLSPPLLYFSATGSSGLGDSNGRFTG